MAKDAGTVPAWEELGWHRYQRYRRHVMPGGEEREKAPRQRLPDLMVLLSVVFVLHAALVPAEVSAAVPGHPAEVAYHTAAHGLDVPDLPGAEGWLDHPRALVHEKVNWFWIDEPYQYPILPGTPEWQALPNSLAAKVTACTVPADVLEHMTTPALYETVLTYPLLANMFAFSTFQMGLDSVSGYFPAMRELFARPDAAAVAAEYSRAQGGAASGSEDIFRTMCIEALESALHARWAPVPGLRQPVPGGRAASLDGVGELVWPPRLRLGGAGRETA